MKSFIHFCKNGFIIYPALVFFSNCLHAQAPSMQWQKCLGGAGIEGYPQPTFQNNYLALSSIQQTTDGGYILAGYNSSNDGDVSGNHGGKDCWIVKINSFGIIQWQKCMGGTNDDEAHSIQQTSDGGYIVAGTTSSNDGDASSNHGLVDCWIVKLNSSGIIQWQKCLGGTELDLATSIRQTIDGGYIVAGYTWSNNGDVTGNHGGSDYWVVKLNSSGIIQWQKCLGGTGPNDGDEAFSIQQTTDGGYIVAGYTNSLDGDVSGNHGAEDYWVVKLNASGNIQWQKCLGGAWHDMAYSIQQTTDGGYIVAGGSADIANDGDVSGNHGVLDYWVVKLNASGNIQWQKCLGGQLDEWATSVQQTNDGGYIVTGVSNSNDGDVSGHHGNLGTSDYWLVKLNGSGIIQWQKSLGGANVDLAYSVKQTSDGGYIVAGASGSTDGDVSGNHGPLDYWVVKLTGTPTGVTPGIFYPANFDLQVHPNPVRQNTMITFNLNAPIRISLDVLNAAGQKTGIIEDRFFSSGNQTISWNTERLPSGVYFVKFRTDNFSITKKLIVIH